PGVAAAQGGRVEPGPLERLPGGLQQQPLLRVHGQRLARGDAEEAGVEVCRLVEEAALRGVGGAWPLPAGVVKSIEVPSTVAGERRDRVGARSDQLPQVLRGAHAPWVPAAHRDDSDGLLVPGLHLVEAFASPVQVCRHPLEVVAELVVVHDIPSSLWMKSKISSSVAISIRSSSGVSSAPGSGRSLVIRLWSRVSTSALVVPRSRARSSRSSSASPAAAGPVSAGAISARRWRAMTAEVG